MADTSFLTLHTHPQEAVTRASAHRLLIVCNNPYRRENGEWEPAPASTLPTDCASVLQLASVRSCTHSHPTPHVTFTLGLSHPPEAPSPPLNVALWLLQLWLNN